MLPAYPPRKTKRIAQYTIFRGCFPSHPDSQPICFGRRRTSLKPTVRDHVRKHKIRQVRSRSSPALFGPSKAGEFLKMPKLSPMTSLHATNTGSNHRTKKVSTRRHKSYHIFTSKQPPDIISPSKCQTLSLLSMYLSPLEFLHASRARPRQAKKKKEHNNTTTKSHQKATTIWILPLATHCCSPTELAALAAVRRELRRWRRRSPRPERAVSAKGPPAAAAAAPVWRYFGQTRSPLPAGGRG